MENDLTSREQLRSQLRDCLLDARFERWSSVYEKGKVRDMYRLPGKRVLITTDRQSAFDHVLGTIPLKGQVLNRIAQYWFEQTADIVPNHVIAVPHANVTIGEELDMFPVEIAPLRQRKEDIAVLASHFVELSARKLNRPVPRLTQGNLLQLQRYDWPGNVRELQNVLERAVITANAGRLRFDLPTDAQPKKPSPADTPPSTQETAILTDDAMRRRERENLLAALRQTKWKISGEGGAAELLGIKPTTLASRMKKMDIHRPV